MFEEMLWRGGCVLNIRESFITQHLAEMSEGGIDHSLRGLGPYGPEADSQLPPCEDYLYRDPDYPIETYVS